MTQIELNIIRLPHSEGLPLPAYESAQAAGLDLAAACQAQTPLTLSPGARLLVPTGMIFEIPNGYEGQIRPRSGLAYKNGISCLNAPGTIDADYRGEIKVLLINHGVENFVVERGQRIAQIIIAPVTQVKIAEKTEISNTSRANSGFGSTGL